MAEQTKAATRKRTSRKASEEGPEKKTTRRTRAKATIPMTVTAEERQNMIREAAYYRAEQRGFQGGSAEEDWLLAEQEVDRALMEGR